jgi:hypothetical protein
MRVTRMIWYAGTMLTALAMLAVSATATAQQQGRSRRAHGGAAATDSAATERSQAENLNGFRGIAAQQNTTPAALENAFRQARAANPTLSRRSFIAANVLAINLGPQHPNITTPAILSGLQRGESIGQTLQSLGLSAAEAKQARRAADRQAKDAEKRVKDGDKRAQADSKEGEQKSRGDVNESKRDNR